MNNLEASNFGLSEVKPDFVWDHMVYSVGFRTDYVSCVPSWEFRDGSPTCL
jgi:hypothetical protein